MIFEEEDIAKIIKAKDLANIGNKMLSTIMLDLVKIRNTKNPLTWNDLATQKYKDYLGDFWELKDGVEKFVMANKSPKTAVIITAQKILSVWNEAIPKLKELNREIDIYNKRFPNNTLKNVEELTGIELREEVRYFNY